MGKKSKSSFQIDLNLKNIKVKKIEINDSGEFHIFLSCDATEATCDKCGIKTTNFCGQCEESIIQHLPILDNNVYLHVNWPRFKCINCNTDHKISFRPDWLGTNSRYTKQYEDYIIKMCIGSSLEDVSLKTGISTDIIEGIISRKITTKVDWNKTIPLIIGIDEIALEKGHNRYLTIITDLTIKNKVQILMVIDGRESDFVLPYLREIPQDVLNNLIAICTDMGSCYKSALIALLGSELYSKIVTIDRFHVAKLVGTCFDDVRKKYMNQIKIKYKDNNEILEKITDSMWPLRMKYDDLDEEKKNKVDFIFNLSPEILVAYSAKQELFNIFETSNSYEDAKIKMNEWCDGASMIEEFGSFIKTFYNHESTILNYFIHKHSSGPVEGANNKIKLIKRRGFGFVNLANFTKRLFLDFNIRSNFIFDGLIFT
jgi:transposase